MVLLFLPALLWAAPPQRPSGIGLVATNLMEPVTMLAYFVYSMSISVGICLVFGSFVKYMRHRQNPMAVPISTVIILFIMGAVLLCLPFIYKLTENGIPVSL
jgi:hypothetical protein